VEKLKAVETYRGTTIKVELHDKVRLEIGVSDPFVQPTVKAILSAGAPAKWATARSLFFPSRRSTGFAPGRRIVRRHSGNWRGSGV